MTPLLTAIVMWLALNFELPATDHHPRIEYVTATEITYMRYRAFTPERRREVAAALAQSGGKPRQAVAIYDDEKQTIYLDEAWTGRTPADLSVLVHEMVHHLQGTAQMKYACPAEREQLAYLAQEKWLSLFGKNLADEFELDGFTLKISTSCGF